MKLGIGAMLHILNGGSPHVSSEYEGKLISEAKIENDVLFITFDDGKKISIYDNGQCCCETRYMSTDDDVSSLAGHRLKHIQAKEGPTESGDYDCEHETCFVEIATDSGFITVTTHNEHNGYYGGFALSIVEVKS